MSKTQAVPDRLTSAVVDELRQQRGMTYVELALASGIPRSTMCNKIRVVDLFTVAELKRLAPALGVSVYELLEGAAE